MNTLPPHNTFIINLEEIKLIASVNWISDLSDFLRLHMMSFNYGLILSRHSTISITVTFIFNIIITPKIRYSYWFMIIFLFLLKKSPNISNYAIFNCFVSNLKRFLTSLIVKDSNSMKRFLLSLIMFSPALFFIFFKPCTFHNYI